MPKSHPLSSPSSSHQSKSKTKPPSSQMGIFLATDANGHHSPTIVSLLLLFSVILLCMRQWTWAWTTFFAAMLLALCSATVAQQYVHLPKEDKQKIRYNIIKANDIVQEMLNCCKRLDEQQQNETLDQRLSEARLVLETGMNALAKKYNQATTTASSPSDKNQKAKASQSMKLFQEEKNNILVSNIDNMAYLCQQAAYLSMYTFPNEDTIVAASLSLLALIAKNESVRERYVNQADEYSLAVPIDCMASALKRSQSIMPKEDDADDDAEQREQFSAELIRKACLFLGALATDNLESANIIVQKGGLDAILKSVAWFRYHANVNNWGLWAIFILCYENPINKTAVVQLNGVPVVVQAMRLCPDSVDVARHGVAVLFDLLREPTESESCNFEVSEDIWKIRVAAVQAGLHEAVFRVMEIHYNVMDIMMMGQEILVGTGYTGDVPEYIPLKI